MKYVLPLLMLLALTFTRCTKVSYVEGLLPTQDTTPAVVNAPLTFANAVDKGSAQLTNVWNSNLSYKIEKYYLDSNYVYYLGFYATPTLIELLTVAPNGFTTFSYQSAADQTGFSPTWALELYSGSDIYRIRNTNTNGYLNVQTGALTTGAIQSGWESAQWYIQ